MEPPKAELEHIEQHFVLCDSNGNISNVTEGLRYDMGLNQKFFNSSRSSMLSLINFNTICPEVGETEVEDNLMNEG